MKSLKRVAPILLFPLLLLPGCQKDSPLTPPAPPPNEPPVIETMRAEPSALQPGATAQFIGDASDADGDVLTYQWAVSAGTMSGGGAAKQITWTAPSTGMTVTVTLTVSDKRESVSDTLHIVVNEDLPNPPTLPVPTENAVNVGLMPTLSWSCSDPQGDALNYHLRFGTNTTPGYIANNLSDTTYAIETPLTASTTYYWQVVAVDSHGNITAGPLWSFSTAPLVTGPPFGEIVFVHYARYLATVDRSGDNLAFLNGYGTGPSGSNPGYAPLFVPGGTADNCSFAVYDTLQNSLGIFNSNGTLVQTVESMPNRYSFSNYGSRIAFVHENADQTQELSVDGVTPIIDHRLVATTDSFYVFSSRPSLSPSSGHVAISTYNADNPNESVLYLYDTDGSVTQTHPGIAWSPRYSHSGDYIAYLDSTDATRLVLTDGFLNPDEEIPFPHDQVDGARALAWSPDDQHIALFSGIFTNTPVLLFFDVTNRTFSSVSLPGPIVMGGKDNLDWAMPSWSDDNNRVTLMIRRNGINKVITVDLDGFSTEAASEVPSVTRPAWRRHGN